jgi:predicted Zn-dependent protease
MVRFGSLMMFAAILISGCSSQGGTMAPVEDRTGSANNSANYGNEVIDQTVDEPETRPYVAPPATAPVQAPSAESRADVQIAPKKTNSAVTSLVTVADVKMKGGQYDQAAASLERALRHDAKNAEVWSKLAEVRLLQSEYAQAETTALKSNALSDGDTSLMARNWRIISKSRRLRGDSVGADEAEVRAYQLGR